MVKLLSTDLLQAINKKNNKWVNKISQSNAIVSNHLLSFKMERRTCLQFKRADHNQQTYEGRFEKTPRVREERRPKRVGRP